MRAAVLALLACACAPPPVGDDAGAPVNDAGVEAPDFSTSLDEGALALLAGPDGAVKHLLPVDGAAPRAPIGAACAFQNTARFPFHLPFLNALLPEDQQLAYQDYIALVLDRATRTWWGGEVAYDAGRLHPLTNQPGVLAYALYTQDEPGDRLIPDDVRAVHALLVACAPAYADRLAFSPTSNEQRTTAADARAALHAEGIAVLGP